MENATKLLHCLFINVDGSIEVFSKIMAQNSENLLFGLISSALEKNSKLN